MQLFVRVEIASHHVMRNQCRVQHYKRCNRQHCRREISAMITAASRWRHVVRYKSRSIMFAPLWMIYNADQYIAKFILKMMACALLYLKMTLKEIAINDMGSRPRLHIVTYKIRGLLMFILCHSGWRVAQAHRTATQYWGSTPGQGMTEYRL